MLAGDLVSRSLDNLLYSLRTGKTGFEKAMGMPLLDWLANHPEDASLFSETMVSFHAAEPAAVASAYDFFGLKTIVDVGGSAGNLLTTILSRHPGPRGILFDLPHVVRGAPELMRTRGVADRIVIEAGRVFESVPAGGDAYLLSHIIHDWSEEQCLAHPRQLPSCDESRQPIVDRRNGASVR